MELKGTKYECKCCVCGHEFLAAKSIFHIMGYIENGAASCPKCNTYLNLALDEENQKMITTKFGDFINKRKGEKVNE